MAFSSSISNASLSTLFSLTQNSKHRTSGQRILHHNEKYRAHGSEQALAHPTERGWLGSGWVRVGQATQLQSTGQTMPRTGDRLYRVLAQHTTDACRGYILHSRPVSLAIRETHHRRQVPSSAGANRWRYLRISLEINLEAVGAQYNVSVHVGLRSGWTSGWLGLFPRTEWLHGEEFPCLARAWLISQQDGFASSWAPGHPQQPTWGS